MKSLNKIVLIGNLGTNPEVKHSPDGELTTRFRLAVHYSYTDLLGRRRHEVDWFIVSTRARTAKTCAHVLRKGRQVYVEGRLCSCHASGQEELFCPEILASRVLFLPPASTEASARSDELARQ